MFDLRVGDQGYRESRVTETGRPGVGASGALIAGPLVFRDHDDGDGSSHTVLTGDYESWVGSWQPSALPPGQKLAKPEHLFKKLDPERVVADELARLQRAADAA